MSIVNKENIKILFFPPATFLILSLRATENVDVTLTVQN